MNLLEELGGKRVLDDIVDFFFASVLIDPLLIPWFQGIDVKKLHDHQVEFLGSLLDSAQYRGRGLREAHEGLGITEEAFAKVILHFENAFKHCNVPGHIAELILNEAIATKSMIVEIPPQNP